MNGFNCYAPQDVRKRLITLAIFVLCAVFVVACTAPSAEVENEEENGQEIVDSNGGAYTPDLSGEDSPEVLTAQAVTDDNIAEFVTLGQYTGLEFTRVPVLDVTDEDVLNFINSHLSQAAEMVNITDRAVENGDIVVIDFEGFHDGVAFEGGTAHGFELTIGSGMFIPGFEPQIIGHEIGDEFDIHVSFPPDYFVPELAGEPVVFRIKIHEIISEVVPELTDEMVQEYLGIDSVEEYKASVREQMEAEREHAAASQERGQIWEQIMDGATIHKYPENEINFRLDMAMQEFELYAMMYGMEVDDLMEMFVGMPLEEFIETSVRPSILVEVGQDLVLRAVAVQEGLSITDEEFQEGLEQFVEDFGFESEDEFLEMHGALAIELSLLANKVIERIMEHSVVL
ncbi:MAG: trigger factor [Oscillospiraceae bacterium]|nr:trigger factor [Oscillospiraceae bacterium]